MKWVCRRCLTAFSSEDILNQHIDRCQKQQPTNITFSWKDHLKFEDYHMKVPVPIRVYADFQCINLKSDISKVLFKQIPIAVGFYIISPFGNNYSSYFGESCVTWFVNEMLTLEKIANIYFETNIPLEITPEEEESFQQSKVCWLCERELHGATESALQKVRDHDHLTGKYRGAAHNRCNLNCKKKASSFIPIIFHNFSGNDCHLIFEELLTQAYKMGCEPKIIPKSMENYVSVEVGCLRFLDSYRFLNSGLDKLVKSINTFPIMDENGLDDELFKKKLAYPYEYLNLSNIQEPINLSPEDFWSTLKQTTPSLEEINRTQEIIKKYDLKNGQELTELYLKMDVLQLADVMENFVEKSTLEYGINPSYGYSLPGYTWKAGLKLTKIKLDFIKDKQLLLLLENNIRGGISSVMGPRYIESNENTKLLYIDENNLYGWAMSQYLPTGDFKKMNLCCGEAMQYDSALMNEIKEDILNTPDDNEFGYFIECDLEYPAEIKEKTENFPLCPYQTKADPECFSEYMNSEKQPNYKPT